MKNKDKERTGKEKEKRREIGNSERRGKKGKGSSGHLFNHDFVPSLKQSILIHTVPKIVTCYFL